jgi:hypothetical protein
LLRRPLRLTSIEFGVIVNRVAAYPDADRRKLENSLALDNFVCPTLTRTGVEIYPPRIEFDDRVLLIEAVAK